PPPPPGFPPLQPPAAPALSARYKTELCRTYSETGRCRYGAKCQFAHGAGELRSLNRHPKYKTELCHKFYLHGECPYGSRCHFVHYPEERGLAASPQVLRQSLSYTGVPAGRQGSPPPGISDPASFARAPSSSPPPAGDLLSPPFARLNSEPVPRMATLGEALAASAAPAGAAPAAAAAPPGGAPSRAPGTISPPPRGRPWPPASPGPLRPTRSPTRIATVARAVSAAPSRPSSRCCPPAAPGTGPAGCPFSTASPCRTERGGGTWNRIQAKGGDLMGWG
ncbi:ZFP36 ring finger protein, partial [Chelydra serpentina]